MNNTITITKHDKPFVAVTKSIRGSVGASVSMAFWSGKLSYFTRLLVYIISIIAFSIQFGNLIGNYSKQTVTNTNMEEKELKDIGFPLVLKICVTPGFNETAIKIAGYKNIFEFFLGKSMHNK